MANLWAIALHAFCWSSRDAVASASNFHEEHKGSFFGLFDDCRHGRVYWRKVINNVQKIWSCLVDSCNAYQIYIHICIR